MFYLFLYFSFLFSYLDFNFFFFFFQVDAWGTDGEDLKITLPTENEISNLISASKNNYKTLMGKYGSKYFTTNVFCFLFK